MFLYIPNSLGWRRGQYSLPSFFVFLVSDLLLSNTRSVHNMSWLYYVLKLLLVWGKVYRLHLINWLYNFIWFYDDCVEVCVNGIAFTICTLSQHSTHTSGWMTGIIKGNYINFPILNGSSQTICSMSHGFWDIYI